MLSTELPFYAESELEYRSNIAYQSLSIDDNDAFTDVSKEAKDLVARLLDKNPFTRINATNALRHQWFKSLD